MIIDNGRDRLLVVKGAPDDILGFCILCEENGEETPKSMDAAALARVRTLHETFARDGFRVLAVAWKKVAQTERHAVVTDETELVFAGFAAFLDPPKASAQEALAKLAHAGVAVKVVTGDNELVTRHICEKLGLPITGILLARKCRPWMTTRSRPA